MEKAVLFFCVFSSWIMQVTRSDESSDLLIVQMGENIVLNCSMRDRYEVVWFRLRSEMNVLMSVKKDRTGQKLLIIYNQNRTRFNILADSWVTTASLAISGVSESDSGLYFCGIKSVMSEMDFDKPIRLEIEGLLPKEQVDIEGATDEVTVTERVLMFGGVGLAVFVFFLATVAAGGIIHHHGRQKGWKEAKRSFLMRQKSAK
ncbi:uncharacterized protein [Pseudorasbora parva]|uniref:uncharacterized protein isoform X2 n=1 Tax=Pseudorasbora parva TaxID=51549 RepID=UPI00351DAB36